MNDKANLTGLKEDFIIGTYLYLFETYLGTYDYCFLLRCVL